MPARSSLTILLPLALAACTTAPTPAPIVVAPAPREYTCAEQRQAAAELLPLPPDAMLRRLLDDARDLRIRLRALHWMPAPAGCA